MSYNSLLYLIILVLKSPQNWPLGAPTSWCLCPYDMPPSLFCSWFWWGCVCVYLLNFLVWQDVPPGLSWTYSTPVLQSAIPGICGSSWRKMAFGSKVWAQVSTHLCQASSMHGRGGLSSGCRGQSCLPTSPWCCSLLQGHKCEIRSSPWQVLKTDWTWAPFHAASLFS